MLKVLSSNKKIKSVICQILCLAVFVSSVLTIYAETLVSTLPELTDDQSYSTEEGRLTSDSSNEFSPAYVPKVASVGQSQLTSQQPVPQAQISSGNLPTSGSELPYIPDAWNNNQDTLSRTNCYAYIFDRVKYPLTNPPSDFYSLSEADSASGKYFAMQPGMLSGGSLNESGSNLPQLLKNDAAKLGLDVQNADKNSAVPKGYYKVALVRATKQDPQTGKTILVDYHMLRQNPDGTWSHKPGAGKVSNQDSNGKVITDPQNAYNVVKDASGNPTIFYNDFAGYYAMKSYK